MQIILMAQFVKQATKNQKAGDGKNQTMKASSNTNTPDAGLRCGGSISAFPGLEQSGRTPAPRAGKSGNGATCYTSYTPLCQLASAQRRKSPRSLAFSSRCHGTLRTRAALE